MELDHAVVEKLASKAFNGARCWPVGKTSRGVLEAALVVNDPSVVRFAKWPANPCAPKGSEAVAIPGRFRVSAGVESKVSTKGALTPLSTVIDGVQFSAFAAAGPKTKNKNAAKHAIMAPCHACE